MKENTIYINPRYVETDQMGVIHHSNYLIYMEQGRLNWLEKIGFSYVEMEKAGVLLPVYHIDIKYKKPMYLSSKIKVVTRLKKLPSTRVEFEYEIMDEYDVVCATAIVVLVFTNAKTFRPMKPLHDFLEKCKKLF
ncbi:MAG: thioesterase family protein [Nonlabens sp.]